MFMFYRALINDALQGVYRSLTFRHGLDDTSKDALNARRCCVVKMVRGLLDLLCSLLSSPAFPPMELLPPSSSSLFTAQQEDKKCLVLLLFGIVFFTRDGQILFFIHLFMQYTWFYLFSIVFSYYYYYCGNTQIGLKTNSTYCKR